jgi:Skp family chaperone for outer membrane proteins
MEAAMTRWKISLALLCVLGVTSVAQAQASPSQVKPQNIVTVSFNAAVLQTDEAKKSLSALEARYAPKQKQLQTLNDEVESLRKQLAATNSNLSDAERATLSRSLESKEKELQRQAEDFKSDSQSESEQVFQRVAAKVYAFLQTFSQQHGYSAVIERGSDAYPVVWYAANNLDITNELIKAYNAQAEGASSAPANAPTHGGAPKSSKPLPDSPSPN